MNRQELHAQAEQNMKQSGPGGDAWLYVYEVTTSSTASRAQVSTRLLRAINDPHIITFKKNIYQSCLDLLNDIEEPTI